MTLPAQPPFLSPSAIALNRFGLGARPDQAALDDPRDWLIGQFARFDTKPAGFAALGDAGALVKQYRAAQQESRRLSAQTPPAGTADPKSVRKDFQQDVQALYRAGVQARCDSALATEAPFVERMVHFWSNHFSISVENAEVTAFAGAFERDAIRPHVLGSFVDMVLAAERHPAMVIYLNQVQSIGPGSPAAARNPDRKRGLNENLAREIMELHTLGVRSGYKQSDVTEFARALTGWTVDGLGENKGEGSLNEFAFRAARHEPGMRTILGRQYNQDGDAQGRAALVDFARSPATATHIATKLTRHFAGDDPPAAMIKRLAESFSSSGGDLPHVYRMLIASPEAWVSRPTKFKTPWEWTISALRGTGVRAPSKMQIAAVQAELGQRVWKPGSPAGWDDIAASWAGPDALLRRVEMAQRLAAPIGSGIDARTLAPHLLPASLSTATAEQIAHAESPTGALALMLVSPEFLRR